MRAGRLATLAFLGLALAAGAEAADDRIKELEGKGLLAGDGQVLAERFARLGT